MIIAVDFDGTLCENKWPEIGDPYPGVIAFCLGQRMTGSKLILWTCRQGKELQAAIDWCRQFHLTFDAVNENLPEHIAALAEIPEKCTLICTLTIKARRLIWSILLDGIATVRCLIYSVYVLIGLTMQI